MGIYSFLKPVVKQCLEDHDYLRPSSKEVLSSLEDISREKCSMPEPFGANHQYVDNCSGSSFTMRTKGHTGGTSGAIHPSCNFDPPTMGGPISTNHPDIDSKVNFLTSSDSMTPPVSKLYVFDKAVECIRQLEKKIDQQEELMHVEQEKHNCIEVEMNERLRNERNAWQENYATLSQELVQTEQELNIATENVKRLEEELDEPKIKHKKLKCDYEKIIHDEKNKYGYDELGRFNRRHPPNPLGRMQSMPAVHQGGYVVKKLPVKKLATRENYV